jgi:hypothetical protein
VRCGCKIGTGKTVWIVGAYTRESFNHVLSVVVVIELEVCIACDGSSST